MLISVMEKNKAILQDREFKFKLYDFSGSLKYRWLQTLYHPIQGW